MNHQESLTRLAERLSALDELQRSVSESGDFTAGYERLMRWDARTADVVQELFGDEERGKFELRGRGLMHAHKMSVFGELVGRYQGFLQALVSDIEQNPGAWLKSSIVGDGGVTERVQPNTREVFVIHGHDDENTLRLQRLLQQRWDLVAQVLRDAPGRGRTLIEKFEAEAARAAYAIALLTPDDLVEGQDGGYGQARPNVVFELGWFYGRLGRQRVCVLMKRGVRLHSDLDGITRLEFSQTVEEVALQLETELRDAGLLT